MVEISQLKIGDRVITTGAYDSAVAGLVGTVRGINWKDSENIQVEFDIDFRGLHDCNGLIPNRNGYNIPASLLAFPNWKERLRGKL